MAQTQAQQRKQFTVPSRDQLVQQIKQLDEQIEHVTLNLIKCDFNATQKDVEKAFTDINFVKIKNYNPGSFQVVFQMKIDAINFIRNHYDKKILNRRFFIKMGRQQKQLVQEWTGVGFVPKTFKAPFTKGPHQNKKQPYNKNRKVQSQTEQKQQETNEQKPVENKQTPVVKQQQQQTKTQQKKQGKHIPKTDYQKKPYNKDNNRKPYTKNQNYKNQQKTQQKTQTVKGQQTKKQVNTKKQEAPKKQDKKQQKVVESRQIKPEPKEQDDGWIVVSKKTTTKRK